MKKIVYGVLVLLGICLVSANFIVDKDALDYKNASASGTTCKWISESGYGVGPYYLEKSSASGKYLSYYKLITSGSSYSWDSSKKVFFSVLPCNSQTAGTIKDGYRLYEIVDNNINTVTGIIKYPSYGSTLAAQYELVGDGKAVSNFDAEDYTTFAKLQQAFIDNERQYRTDGQRRVAALDSGGHGIYGFGNSYLPILHSGASYTNPHDVYLYSESINFQYPSDVNGDGEWTFTCVCAEY